MFEYDATLKLLLKGSATVTIETLSGLVIARWHDVELPKVELPRLDLLGECEDGRLLHIELQITNDPQMPLRMAEYGLKVARLYGQHPKQVLLYVGQPPLLMWGEYAPNGDVSYRYRVVDIRELDGELLLESEGIGDNVLAILAKLRDQREAARQIVQRIATLGANEGRATMDKLLILAGIRSLGSIVREEARRMPITEDILNHDVIGPVYRDGEIAILRRLITERFGAFPDWLEERLKSYHPRALEEISVRVLKAETLEDIVK